MRKTKRVRENTIRYNEDSYDSHERENVMFEVVPVISSHFDVDSDQNFDVPFRRMRPLPPSTPLPLYSNIAAAVAAVAAAAVSIPMHCRFRIWR